MITGEVKLEVNTSRPEKYRYWVVFLLKDLPVGYTFQPGFLHITIIPWFVSDEPDEQITNSFTEKFSGFETFNVKVGPQVKFGPRREVSVNLLEDASKIVNLHQMALNWFNEIKARWAVKNPYIDEQFTPHVRRRQGTKLETGQILHLHQLILVRALRHEDNNRLIVAKVDFNG